jgi:nitric oxide reductase activation protein
MRSLFAQLCLKKWDSLKTRRLAMVAAMLLTMGWVGTASVAAAQQAEQPGQLPGQAQTPFGAPRDREDPTARQREEKLAKERNVDRQQKLVSDTEKLLALAQQLKDEVDRSNKDTLSVEVVKKATEIEKLAKSVKERMRE